MRTIAVDATGGDCGTPEVLKAVAQVSLEDAVVCRVIGHIPHLEAQLARHHHDPTRLVLTEAGAPAACDSTLPDDAQPDALRAAAELVRSGAADAAVSAGDTGHCIRTWLEVFPLLPGATRPALASFFPRQARTPDVPPAGLLLDVGATLRCHPRDYSGFALMGAAYYQGMTGYRPRVGLLNVGTEQHKGGESLARAAALLADLQPTIDFVGNVEGTDLFNGEADVVLSDGFTGNVLLKTLEGVADTAGSLVGDAIRHSWLWRLGILLLSDGLQALRRVTDYSQYGGSPLLGVRGLLIKAHGRSQAPALKNAIRAAARAAELALPNQLESALEAVRSLGSRSWLRLGHPFRR